MDTIDFERDLTEEHCVVWQATRTLPTPLGDFRIEAVMLDDGDDSPPDAKMIEGAVKLYAFVRENPAAILEKVREHYLRVADQPEMLRMARVPAGLTPDDLAPYLEEFRIIVTRDSQRREPPYIDVGAQWAVEHGIELVVNEGTVEFR